MMTTKDTVPAKKESSFRNSWRLVFAFPSELDVATFSELLALCRRLIDFELQDTMVIGIEVPITGDECVDGSMFDALSLPFNVRRGDAAGLLSVGLSVRRAREATHGRATWLIDPEGKVRASLCYPFETARSITELLRLTMVVRSADALGVPTPEGWKPGDDEVVPSTRVATTALC